jgi:CRISPR-associated endonuclease Cas1
MLTQTVSRAELTLTRECTDGRVWIAHGYGVKLTVEAGHLVLTDGVSIHRRERRVSKIDRTLRRIIITGTTGFVSLGALSWCRDHHIAVVVVNSLGEATDLYPGEMPADGPTLREQAACGPGGRHESTGLEIARMITARKLARQAEVAWNTLDSDHAAREIRRLGEFIGRADSIEALGLLEAEAARRYFWAWSDVSIRWSHDDVGKVPEHWHSYAGRKNLLASGNRNAVHPVNALLNYAYRMLEIQAVLACHAAGLNPTLGFIHTDRYDRDSLALDIMECVRPEVDEFILGMLAHCGNDSPRIFSRREFTDIDSKNYPAGTVRLLAPLTHEIAEKSASWSASLYAVAEEMAKMIAASSMIRVVPREITTDKTMMRQIATPKQIPASRDVLPDDVWELVSGLAEQLPHPKAAQRVPPHREVVAALLAGRIYRISREHLAPAYGISENTLDRRSRAWRHLDAWHKLESVTRDHLTAPQP